MRDNGAHSIITFIAISDFFIAFEFGYMIGSINLLAYTYNDYLVKQNWNRCSVFKNICEIESCVVTWATMSSYFWTIILPFYFYLSIAHNRNITKRLMPLYHVLSWGAPILVAFPLLYSLGSWHMHLLFLVFGATWRFIAICHLLQRMISLQQYCSCLN